MKSMKLTKSPHRNEQTTISEGIDSFTIFNHVLMGEVGSIWIHFESATNWYMIEWKMCPTLGKNWLKISFRSVYDCVLYHRAGCIEVQINFYLSFSRIQKIVSQFTSFESHLFHHLLFKYTNKAICLVNECLCENNPIYSN